MKIKHHRNRNDYVYVGESLWVRDFTKKLVVPFDINRLIQESETHLLMSNEQENSTKMYQRIDTESFNYQNIIIVGDGYKFAEKQHLLANMPDTIIIGVNESLLLWNNIRKMNYYVVNNPYPECIQLLPEQPKTFPRCIASLRTNPKFLSKFKNLTYTYTPTPDEFYGGLHAEADYLIDDYRNAICASLNICWKFNAKKILLFCCDESFDNYRPGSIQLDNKLWIYPQQVTGHKLIDGMLYWLKTADIKLGYYCDGPEYKNATYINDSELVTFFN